MRLSLPKINFKMSPIGILQYLHRDRLHKNRYKISKQYSVLIKNTYNSNYLLTVNQFAIIILDRGKKLAPSILLKQPKRSLLTRRLFRPFSSLFELVTKCEAGNIIHSNNNNVPWPG